MKITRRLPETRLDPEYYAYPSGGFHRRGMAIVLPNKHNPEPLPYGEVRAVKASIPDTYFSIPARLRYRRKVVVGYLSLSRTGAYLFRPEADPATCPGCAPGEGCKS